MFLNSIGYESKSNQTVVLAKLHWAQELQRVYIFVISSNELFIKYYTGKLSVGKDMKISCWDVENAGVKPWLLEKSGNHLQIEIVLS